MKQAYMTLICGGDAYLPGVEALGRSLVESGSRVPRIALTTPDVPQSALRALASDGWQLREVEELANPHHGDELLFRRFSRSFTKLRVFQQSDLERVVFLDADTLVLRNIDHLFEHPSIAAAPDFFLPDRFNSGVLVLGPSLSLFDRLCDALAAAPSYDGGDQGFLNWFWNDWWSMPPAHRLKAGYNMPHFTFQFLLAHPSLRESCLHDIHIVHYTLQKPWMSTMITGGVATWWQKFYAAHPEQDTSWRRRLHQLQDWSFESLVSLLAN